MRTRRDLAVLPLTLLLACLPAFGCIQGDAQSLGGEGGAALAALEQSGALARLVERSAPPVSATGAVPSFVVDPGWPRTLPKARVLRSH